MNKELKIIQFRFRQFFRICQTIGWGYLLVLCPILFLFTLGGLESIRQLDHPSIVGVLYGMLTIPVHLKRKDLSFLQQIRTNRPLLFWMEYQLLCLPLSIALLAIGLFEPVIYGHILVTVLAFILVKINLNLSIRSSNWALSFLPNHLFEWKASIRKHQFFFLAIWIIGWFTATNRFAYFVFFFLFLGLIPDAFNPTEGKELKPTSFGQLHLKVLKNGFFLSLLLLPHFLIYLYCNPSYWFVIVGIYSYLILIQTYSIYYKYAHFSQYGMVYNEVPTLLFMFLAPILPISLLLLLKAFFKARKRINYA